MCRLWGVAGEAASLGLRPQPCCGSASKTRAQRSADCSQKPGPLPGAALLGRKELRWAGPRAEGLWVREAGPVYSVCMAGRVGGGPLCRPFPGDTGAPRGGVPAQWGGGECLREGQGGGLVGLAQPLGDMSVSARTAHAARPRVSLLGSSGRCLPPDAPSLRRAHPGPPWPCADSRPLPARPPGSPG